MISQEVNSESEKSLLYLKFSLEVQLLKIYFLPFFLKKYGQTQKRISSLFLGELFFDFPRLVELRRFKQFLKKNPCLLNTPQQKTRKKVYSKTTLN